MWQPIATATREKDKPIMVWNGQECAIVEPLGNTRWLIANAFGFCEDGEVYDVTHWMPLPEGPKA